MPIAVSYRHFIVMHKYQDNPYDQDLPIYDLILSTERIN